MTTESNCDTLIEKQSKYEIELNTLRSQCVELTALLDDIRSRRKQSEALDSSIDINASNLNENLASIVVEIQLEDAEIKNNQLQTLLDESVQKSAKLEEELLMLKCRHDKLNEDHTMLLNYNKELQLQVSCHI